jgi:hypothetical protein
MRAEKILALCKTDESIHDMRNYLHNTVVMIALEYVQVPVVKPLLPLLPLVPFLLGCIDCPLYSE